MSTQSIGSGYEPQNASAPYADRGRFNKLITKVDKVAAFKDLIPQLQAPETLVLSGVSSCFSSFLQPSIDSTNAVFTRLNAVKEILEARISQTKEAKPLNKLLQHYQSFVDLVCNASPEERLALLCPTQGVPNSTLSAVVMELLISGSFDSITQLQDAGFVLNQESLGKLFLHDLVRKKSAAAVSFATQNLSFPFENRNNRGETPLHIAAKEDSYEAVLTLISVGASQEAEDLDKTTPLHLATRAGATRIVEFLLDNESNPAAATSVGQNILHIAVANGHAALLEKLLQRPPVKALLEAADHDGKTPLHLALWGSQKAEIVRTLLDNGANANAQSTFKYTPLHWAAKHGHLESLQMLYNAGALIDIENDNHDTPPVLALRHGQDAVTLFFLDPTQPLTNASLPNLQPQEKEAIFTEKLQEAYLEGDARNQVLFLDKLGDLFLENEDYVNATKWINAALAAVRIYDFSEVYSAYLTKKLERIEGELLKSMGRNTPAGYLYNIRNNQESLDSIRTVVASLVEEGKPVEFIQRQMSALFQKILESFASNCLRLLGEPPTAFAIMGLGLLARNEMLPYSPIEFAVVIKDSRPENMIYFRNFCRLIQLKILNLGETTFPMFSAGSENRIEVENGLNRRGFSIDNGGITPLGQSGVYELIGEPQQLAEYFNPEKLTTERASVGLEYTLANYSFIMGDQRLVNTFGECKKEVLRKKERIRDTKFRRFHCETLLRKFVSDYEALMGVRKLKFNELDVKNDLYIPLRLILDALAFYHKLEQQNSFQQIDALRDKKVFTEFGAEKLKSILRIIDSWLIETHLHYRTEKENICDPDNSRMPNARTFTEEDREKLQQVYSVFIPFAKAARNFYRHKRNSFLTFNPMAQQVEEFNHTEARFPALHPHISLRLRGDGYGNPTDTRRMRTIAQQLEFNLQRLSLATRNHHGVSNQIETAHYYYNIGCSYRDLGENDKALQFLNRSLEIKKSVFGENHSEVAAMFKQIGAVLQTQRKLEEALAIFEQALVIYEETLPRNHPDNISTHYSISLCQFDLNRVDEGLETYLRALRVHETILPKNHPDIGKCHANLAATLFEKERYTDALIHFQKALNIHTTAFGEDNLETTALLYDIAMTQYFTDRFEDALATCQHELEIELRILTGNHSLIASTNSNIGDALVQLGRHEEALRAYEIAKSMRIELFGMDDVDTRKNIEDVLACQQAISRKET